MSSLAPGAPAARQTGYANRAHCPGCGESAARARHAVASEPPAESLALGEHGRFLSGYTARRVFFTYRRCARCGLLFCPVYYTNEQLLSLYGRQAENMADVPLRSRLRTQARYVDLLENLSVPAGGYLELGADIGLFAEQCAGKFHFDGMWLFEPNKEVQPELRQRLSGRPLHIVDSLFAIGDVPPASIALAVAIHVLDHVFDPLQSLTDLATTLAPGGLLLVVAHDERSLLARALGRRWPPYTLQHPQLYSAATLPALIERAGLQSVKVRKTVNYFPFFHFVRGAIDVLGMELPFLRTWRGPEIGIRLGNIAAVGRKPA